MRRSTWLAGQIVLALAVTSAASAAEHKQSVDMKGGRITVTLGEQAADAAPSGPKANPKIGVSLSVEATAPGLARALDETGKAKVTSPARFGTAAGSFDGLTRSEFEEELVSSCARNKLDYALYSSAPGTGVGYSATALLGFGRFGQTQMFELRLYDCKSRLPVWKRPAKVEMSQGMWRMALGGGMRAGTGQEVHAASGQIIAERMVADLGI